MAPVPMANARSTPRWNRAKKPVSAHQPRSHPLARGLSVRAPISLAIRLAHSRHTRRAGRRDSFDRLCGLPSTPT